MCDYSLEMYASRPAREGEIYQTTRFTSGSLGLASPGDCGTAVCVQYDTRLELDNLPSALRAALGVGSREMVTFVRLDAGIGALDQASLFQRFVTLSSQPTGGETATGLGLALAKQRARAMGGDLWYEDNPGGGACFTLELPRLE